MKLWAGEFICGQVGIFCYQPHWLQEKKSNFQPCPSLRLSLSLPGPRFIKLTRYELVLIAHLHMRIVKIQQVVQSARILPIHVKEGDIQGKSTSFYILVSGRPRSREL